MKRAPVELTEWYCGDEECGCSQLQVTRVEPNPKYPGWVIPTTLWEGTLHTDHEALTDDDYRAAIVAAHELGAFVYPDSYILKMADELGLTPPPLWNG